MNTASPYNEANEIEKYVQKSLLQENPNVKWEDIAGLEKAKESLKEAISIPLEFPQLFQGKRKPMKCTLLYGPPGTGKSLLAKAVATENIGHFFLIHGNEIITKWNVLKPEKLIKNLFELARKKKPATIFIDDLDIALGIKSNEDDVRRITVELLTQQQGVENEGIFIFGATNKPWELVPAIKRRFQKTIFVSLPDYDARKKMLEIYLKGISHSLTNDQIEELAKKTEMFSGSDIYTFSKDAIYEPIRKCQSAEYFMKIPGIKENEFNYIPCGQDEPGAMKMKMEEIPDIKAILPPKVTYEDYIDVLKKNRPTVTKQDLEMYEKFTKEF